MNKKVITFLSSKGFVQHPSETGKMIKPFSDNGGGVIVYCYGKSYEMILGFLPKTTVEPEFLFSGLTEPILLKEFDRLFLFLSQEYDKLKREGY